MTLAHWVYALGTVAVVVTMLLRKNVIIPCIVSAFIIGLLFEGSVVGAVTVLFNAQMAALVELGNIFLIIALMVAMLKALTVTGADQLLVSPMKSLMVNPSISYLVICISAFVVSLFFWPTPAVPLVGALLVPAAVKVGLPPIASAVAIAIAGQGMALAADTIIQGATGLSAAAAAVPVDEINIRAFILSAITGIIALVLAWLMMKKDIQTFDPSDYVVAPIDDGNKTFKKKGSAFAPFLVILLVVCMVADVFAMLAFKIRGGDAAALLGGTAVLIMTVATLVAEGFSGFDRIADHLTEGLCFAFNVMGQILPIAGFFFLGNPESVVGILGEGAPGYLFDIGQMIASMIPAKGLLSGFGMLGIGIITGLDGSGFSGLPMTGTLSGALAAGNHALAATLASIGQMGAIWAGGGTIVAWSSLVAVAGVVGVPVLDLVRKNFIPVITGLIVSTVIGIMFLA